MARAVNQDVVFFLRSRNPCGWNNNRCVVMYVNFANPDQVLTVVSQDQSGWWTGEKGGRKGLFPSNYVNLI